MEPTTTTTNVTEFLDKKALRKLLELLLAELKTTNIEIEDTIPANSETVNSPAYANKVPSVKAVYNAIRTINHVQMKLITGTTGQSFKDAMQSADPEELTFYLYKDGESDKLFELWIYDSQQGDYVQIGNAAFDGSGTIELSNYWSKDELKLEELATKEELEEYVKKEELESKGYVTSDTLEGYVTNEQLEEKGYLTSESLEGYLKAEDIQTISPEDVQSLYEEVKQELED